MFEETTIQINNILFEKNSEQLKQELRDTHGSLINNTIDVLEEENLFNWIDVLYESRQKDIDKFSSKDFIQGSVMSYTDIVKILYNSDKARWNDPTKFGYTLYMKLADSINTKFESDEEYIKYLEKNTELTERKIDNIKREYKKLNFQDRDYQIYEEYQSKFVKLYLTVSLELSEFNISQIDKRPQKGQYIIYNPQTHDNVTDGKVVLEVIDSETVNRVFLSDLTQEISKDDEEDFLLQEVQESVLKTLDYEGNKLFHLFSEEGQFNLRLSAEQKSVTVCDENPLRN